jgi:hypothetical protein
MAMNQAAILIPGELLPYYVVDYALDWATENEGSLKVIFFLPRHIPSESYPFPNDLDQAEMLKESFDVEEGIKEVLKQERRYIEKRANARHVPVECVILFSPSIDDLASQVNRSEIVFVDKNIDEKADAFDGLSFTSQDLRDKLDRLLPIGEYDRYSDVVY